MTTERKTATELFDRYMGRTGVVDARFRAIVDLLVAHMMDQKIAPDEIRDAAFVASIKYLQLNPVRELIYERDDIRWPGSREDSGLQQLAMSLGRWDNKDSLIKRMDAWVEEKLTNVNYLAHIADRNIDAIEAELDHRFPEWRKLDSKDNGNG